MAARKPDIQRETEALREKIAEDKLAIDVRTDPRSIYAGALGAALWGAFRHRVLVSRSAA